MYEDPKSKISQLQKVLDAREDLVSGKEKKHELHDRNYNVKTDWSDNDFQVGSEITSPEPVSAKSSFSVKFLIGSAIFFVLTLMVVAYNFLGGGNLVSGNNIAVTVKAPISVSGGEVFPFEIEIKNNNSLTLSGVDMNVTFPIGAVQVDDPSTEVKRVQAFLGDILPGQTFKKNLSVVFFGTEKEKKEISITLEYKIAGSNSLFNKTKTFSVLLASSPVSLVVSGPTEVNTNQAVDFSVDITSNSPSIIKNLLLKVDYPFGFTFKRSDPQTVSKDNLWLIGDLEAGAKRTIKFSGTLNGQEEEERGFTFNLGSQSKAGNLTIDTPFSSTFSSVTINRPFVSADVFLNDDSSIEYVSTAGDKVEAVIKWQNNLSYEVSDVSIIVSLQGNALNKGSIQVDEGFYRSIDNTIIFNKNTNPLLASLNPGQEGKSKFSFGSFGLNSVTGSGLINPTILLDFTVKGRRVDYAGGQEDVLFSDSRKVKITANPQLLAKALYYVGPFQNSGPIPPTAEKETTYTITWTVINPLNNLSNVQVSTVLPPYITWLGQISPNREKIDYNSDTGLVVWSLGNVPAGAGKISPAREISFQISFLPSVDQIGKVPELTGVAELRAKDSFTLTTVSDSASALTTRLNNDPYFRNDTEEVIQ